MVEQTTLAQLSLNDSYRSDKNDVVSEFYVPTLSCASVYKRAVGYFSLNGLLSLDAGINQFVRNGGKIQFIASTQLSHKDVECITRGYELREEIQQYLVDEIQGNLALVIPELAEDRLTMYKIMILIGVGKLDVKIAVSKLAGIFHEKIGIIADESGNKLSFTGSLNETSRAFHQNFESIDVMRNWLAYEQNRVEQKEADFDRLWENHTTGLEVVDFTDALYKNLIAYQEQLEQEFGSKQEVFPEAFVDVKIVQEESFRLPSWLEVREYQKEAYQNFVNNRFRGIYEMATGTGKTITALYTLTQIQNNRTAKNIAVIVVVPYIHLAEQWAEEMQQFGVTPIIVNSNYPWEGKLKSKIAQYNLGQAKVLAVITTNDSLKTPRFQQQIQILNNKFVFIVDEAHNVGTEKLINSLPNCQVRLGLTATLERHNDKIGSKKILEYFSKTVFEFPMAKAIAEGFLTPYKYYPHVIHLDDSSRQKYRELFAGEETLEDLKVMMKNMVKTKEIIRQTYTIADGSFNKFAKFKETIEPHQHDPNILVYCTSYAMNDGEQKFEDLRQIDAVTQYLGSINMNCHRFTQSETLNERKQLIQRFSDGDLQALVAIRCMDEGVDIPATRHAFILASTTNPKQWVQRRGRVLRKYPGKEFAEIHDYITLPSSLEAVSDNEFERHAELFLIKREYARLCEFGSLALNSELSLQVQAELEAAYPELIVEREREYEEI